MKKIKKYFAPLITLLLITAPQAAAQSTTTARKPDFPDVYYNILAIGLITIVIAIFMAFLIFGMDEGKMKEKVVKESLWARLKVKLSGAAPVEKENEIMLEHNFDGIKELDNKIPPWFTYLFYATIIFSVYYLLQYHVFSSGDVMVTEYAQEMKAAAEQRAALEKSGAFVNEANVTVLNDISSIAEGKKIFETNCVVCHAAGGAGLVGPNLTDEYWIHGAGINNVFKTIKYGVPAKGMQSWMAKLNPKQIQQVSSYILSLKGTNPPNAKAPQGQKFASVPDTLKTASL